MTDNINRTLSRKGSVVGITRRYSHEKTCLRRTFSAILIPVHVLSIGFKGQCSIPLQSQVRKPYANNVKPYDMGAEQASKLLVKAQSCISEGEHKEAFEIYDKIIREYGDLALAEYARLGRALMRYELNDKAKAIIELEDEAINNVGLAEAHAALTAALWQSRKSEIAETQWEIAMEFDSRYADMQWVSQNKHWGPQLMEDLNSFLQLQTT